MRILLVHAHPNPLSFNHAIVERAVIALEAAGHSVDRLDLYAEGFNPVMSREERASYHTAGINLEPPFVRDHLARLKAAEGLLLVFPTWWYDMPAILKGWLDRVWVPHETFTLPTSPSEPIRGLMTNLRWIGGITTTGAPWWWTKIVGEPARRVICRGIRAICARRCRTAWLSLHSMDKQSDAARTNFLTRVAEMMAMVR